ncbi:GNAT family N-acetyltransferase [Halosegnis marinus]|uniref:GNAT family N-acetyltransferase n=1 Tax=Halosegnis marinus TaxID=3034023 RepID=UPI003605F095
MSLFPATMETDRLRFEAIRPGSLDPVEMYEHVRPDAPAIDEVTRYLRWGPHPTPKATAEFVARAGEAYEASEDVHYTVRPTEGDLAGEFLGTAGFHPDWDREVATLGVWFREVAWGNGYSGERAARMLELAFERLDLAYVKIDHDARNERSRRAIEKYVERFGGRKEEPCATARSRRTASRTTRSATR